jgi:hypothetical protein
MCTGTCSKCGAACQAGKPTPPKPTSGMAPPMAVLVIQQQTALAAQMTRAKRN